MVETKNIASVIHLEKADLTLMDIEAIVFYAQHNLVLGSGFGNAIADARRQFNTGRIKNIWNYFYW